MSDMMMKMKRKYPMENCVFLFIVPSFGEESGWFTHPAGARA